MANPDSLNPEQPGVSAEALLELVTAVPANRRVVDGALQLVVTLAGSAIAGAHGASVSLLRDGVISTVAATDDTVLEMDHSQYSTGEGPCLDASKEGLLFYTESLLGESRWPNFVPKARELGINSILSSPLHAQGAAVGALNIYSRIERAFDAKNQELASIVSTEASLILNVGYSDVRDDQLTQRLSRALRIREAIAQAQGIVMGRDAIDAEDAFRRLRESAQAAGLPLREHAMNVVASVRAKSASQKNLDGPGSALR